MAFTVEDGTIVAGANSYTTIAYADAYFEDRDNTVWAVVVDDADKEGYLIRATDYIESVYGRRFIGEMVETDQPLSWPRTDADPYADDVIPDRLQKAACEYALRAIDGPLMPDPAIDATGFSSVVKKKVVGPIEKEFEIYGSSAMTVRPYPAADALIAPLIMPGSGTRVIR